MKLRQIRIERTDDPLLKGISRYEVVEYREGEKTRLVHGKTYAEPVREGSVFIALRYDLPLHAKPENNIFEVVSRSAPGIAEEGLLERARKIAKSIPLSEMAK